MTETGPSAAFADLVIAVAEDLKEAREDLNRLDGVAGDGDLGLTVSAGAHALMTLAPELTSLPEAEAIRRCGMEIARRAPSTGGTLIAFAFLAAARADVDPDAPPVERAARYLAAAAESIATRGKVAPGDRTMLDALQPAVEAVRSAADRGNPWLAVRGAAESADAGSRSTAAMAAKVGRAGWLADRAAGHEDAGAYVVALAFAAAARYRAAVEGRHENGRADHFEWQSLFIVLAEPRAAPIAEALMPGLRIDDRMREIAGAFLRSEAVVTTNAEADRAVDRAIAALESATDGPGFVRLAELGALLVTDTSEQEYAAWTWVSALRRWAREPVMGEPQHRELAASILAAPGLEALESTVGSELPPWQALLSNAQQRRIVRALEARIEAMSPESREALLKDARATTAEFGVPREHIPI